MNDLALEGIGAAFLLVTVLCLSIKMDAYLEWIRRTHRRPASRPMLILNLILFAIIGVGCLWKFGRDLRLW